MKYLSAFGAAVAFLLPSVTFGQQSSAPASSAPASDQVVALSAFSVTSDTAQGYAASESITGSRVATKIMDLPFDVNVVTSDFMNDFGILDPGDDLSLASSFGSYDQGGRYVSRGFIATKLLWNGFERLGLLDPVDIEELEIIKGPAAAVYGETAPGGLLNAITKQPESTPEQELSATYGYDRTFKAALSSTGPLLPTAPSGAETYYRIDADTYTRDYDPYLYLHTRERTAYGAITHKVNDDTVITFDAEYIYRPENTFEGMPYNTETDPRQSGSELYFESLATELGYFNSGGPNKYNINELSTFVQTLEHQFNDVFSMRISADEYNRHTYQYDPVNSLQYNPALLEITGVNPTYNDINQYGGELQADLIADNKIGSVSNKALLTFDRTDDYQNEPQWTINNLAKQPYKTLSVVNPDYGLVPLFNPTTVAEGIWGLKQHDDNRIYVDGFYLRDQVSAWDGRLIAYAGARYDDIGNRLYEEVANVRANYSDHAWTPQGGFNFKIVPDVAFYANYTTSYDPNTQTASATDVLPNQTAYSYEAGFKTALLDGRLNSTLGVYSITERNLQDTEPVETAPGSGIYTKETVAAGTARANGVDYDFNWSVTDNLAVLGSYGWVKSQYLDDGIDTYVVGRPPQRVPRQNLSVAARYNVAAVRGLALLLDVRYWDKVETALGAGREFNGGLYDYTSDGKIDVWIPSYVVWGAGAVYQWKNGHRIVQALRLNAKNLFDKQYIYFNAGAPAYADRLGFFVSYDIKY